MRESKLSKVKKSDRREGHCPEDKQPQRREVKLNVATLEERIAPAPCGALSVNRSETFLGEVHLEVEPLEERIAPVVAIEYLVLSTSF